jgi:hypothetical protein
MEASGSSPAAFFRGRPLRLVALLGVVAAIVVAVLAFTGGDDEGDGGDGGTTTVNGPAGNEFTLQAPAGWTAAPEDQRQAIPGSPLVVLRREDQQGLVVVNVQPGKVKSFDKQVKVLDRRLEKAIPDFQKVGARIVEVKAGKALLYSYARRERGTAHTLLVVPAGDRSYSVNGAVPAGENDAAREMGSILLSFDR